MNLGCFFLSIKLHLSAVFPKRVLTVRLQKWSFCNVSSTPRLETVVLCQLALGFVHSFSFLLNNSSAQMSRWRFLLRVSQAYHSWTAEICQLCFFHRLTLCCVSLETRSSSEFYMMILSISRMYSNLKESKESLITFLLKHSAQVTVQNPCLYVSEINPKVTLVLAGIEMIYNSAIPLRIPLCLPHLAPLWAASICKSTYKNNV